MSHHPDADAFLRAILDNPAEVTTRLAFADWLEETGDASNVAWAHFIRLLAEVADYTPGSRAHEELDRRASEFAKSIRVTLRVDASQLAGHVEHFWRLLPRPNLAVTVAGYEIPLAVIELVPESVARENVVLPLSLEGNTLKVATAEPTNLDPLQKLQFILNKDIAPVCAGAEAILAAINWYYGETETESVDSILVEFVDTAVDLGRHHIERPDSPA